MNELINELVDCIKDDQRYLDFIQASQVLQKQDVMALLERYQTVLDEVNDLKRFDQYIDNSAKKNELKEIKKEIAMNSDIQYYYQCYYQINDLLDYVTKIVFHNISDSLNITGVQL